MKLLIRTLSLLTIASLALFFANCGGGGGETDPKKVQLGKLKTTWNIVSAELTTGSTPVDRTADFSGFTLTFDGDFDPDAQPGEYPYSFSVGGSRPDPSPWPGSGFWGFASVDGNSGTIERNDGVGIFYDINSAGQLTLQFLCTDCDYAGNRTSQVNGTWEFVLD